MKTIFELAHEVNAVRGVHAMGRHDGILFTEGELERFVALVRKQVIEELAGVPVGPTAWQEFDGEGYYHFKTFSINESYLAKGGRRNPMPIGRVEPLYTIESLAAKALQDAADTGRLDFMIANQAYVVSDPDTCAGFWLRYAHQDGTTWVQVDSHATPRQAIDAARGAEEQAC